MHQAHGTPCVCVARQTPCVWREQCCRIAIEGWWGPLVGPWPCEGAASACVPTPCLFNHMFVQPTCMLRHMFVRQRLAPEQAHAEQTHGWPLFHVRPVHVSVASTCGCCDVVVMWAQHQACCAFCAPTEALVGGEWCSGQFRAACSTAHRCGSFVSEASLVCIWLGLEYGGGLVAGWWKVGELGPRVLECRCPAHSQPGQFAGLHTTGRVPALLKCCVTSRNKAASLVPHDGICLMEVKARQQRRLPPLS